MRNEDYDTQKKLFERFIENSNLKDFDKMKQLSDNNHNYNQNYNNNISNNKNFNVKNLFHSYKYEHPSYEIFKKIKNNNYFDDKTNANLNDIRNSYTPNEINNFKIDFNKIYIDPEFRNKCLKGNYKWGNMRFNMQKINMAKRRGVSFEDLKMNKIDKNLKKKSTMEINGRMIIDNINPHIKSDFNNKSQTDGVKEYNKKMIIDIINKNSDFIKRKYSGKINGKSVNRYQNNILNEKGIYDLII